MFITSSAVVELWRTHTATHPGLTLAHPALVCPSTPTGDKMTETKTQDATTTNGKKWNKLGAVVQHARVTRLTRKTILVGGKVWELKELRDQLRDIDTKLLDKFQDIVRKTNNERARPGL